MFGVLSNPTFARLYGAQAVAMLGTGLLTIALGLLAYDLAGDNAGAVLGMALTIKMVAYVGLAPLASAVVQRLPRKSVLIGADLVRAGVALCLPFVDGVWQVYALIFVLQAASATFTPAFQATIPEVVTDEEDYTRALSLSRLAFDIETLISPVLAGLLLLVMPFHWLFAGTGAGFLGSALLVASAALPPRGDPGPARGFADRVTRGLRIYLATPRLRGLLAINLAAAALSAHVLVNTVVTVLVGYGRGEGAVTAALAAFGFGSMVVALGLPRILGRVSDRRVMTMASAAAAALLVGHALWLGLVGALPWAGFLALWLASGAAYSAMLTPSGRLLRRSAHREDLPAVFAAQFALSHACWLVCYPLAGWAGAAFGMGAPLALLGGLAAAGTIAARRVWPEAGVGDLAHSHPDLPPDHPHLRAHAQGAHSHRFVIDDIHPAWPTRG